MKNYIYILIVLLFASCQQRQDGFIASPAHSTKDIQYKSIALDTIRMDSVNTSSFGESLLLPDDRIAFVDKRLCTVSLFDAEGRHIETTLGLGGGPKETEIGRIAAQAMLNGKDLILFGANLDFHVFNPDFSRKEIFILNRKSSEKIEESSESYTNQYNDMVCRSYGDKVYFNVYSDHPDFNYLDHTSKYLNECRHIWEIDAKNHADSRLLAPGYPPVYFEDPHKYLIFHGICFDMDKSGNFYVSYDADSLIYAYDNAFNPIATFGYEGRDMDKDYTPIYSYKESRKHYREQRNSKGYYYWLEYVDETGLLFRSYQKGSEPTDGLQIYKDGTLVGDVDVPKRMRIMGYIAPYYYSYIIPNLDETDNSLIIYRFKID